MAVLFGMTPILATSFRTDVELAPHPVELVGEARRLARLVDHAADAEGLDQREILDWIPTIDIDHDRLVCRHGITLSVCGSFGPRDDPRD
jgi:hypothetical protein